MTGPKWRSVYRDKVKAIDESKYPLRPTARDLLEAAVGERHALHTVVASNASTRTHDEPLRFRCSCGGAYAMAPTFARLAALRNVFVSEEALNAIVVS